MLNFTFCNPTKILFGQGRIAELGREIPPGARLLLTYGGGSVIRNGVLAQVKAALSGYQLFEFGGIEANPSYETLMAAVPLCRAEQIDFLLAVGGGSVLDGTKFIAGAVAYPGDPWEMVARRAPLARALPLGCVLTLPATGSEMNCGAVISHRGQQAKLPFFSPLLYPRFSVLDPTTTYTLPPRQISNGVVDTFVHIIEQYLTYPVQGVVQDRLAEGLLLALREVGPAALAKPGDYAIRANLMWCATLGLNGLIGAGVPQDWATHMLGHELTLRHGLDHGQTLAIVLPSLLAVRREEKRAKLRQFAERVWGITAGSEESRIDGAIAMTRAFFESLGVKTRLGDYQISAASIPQLVAQLEAHGMVRLGEHGDLTPEISRRIFELSL